MKNSILFSVRYKFVFVAFILLFCFGPYSIAQNASYDANTVPITGIKNSAFGFRALFSNTTGSHNQAFGFEALYSNTSGENNVAVGLNALNNSTSGSYNAATGHFSLYSNTTGSSNSANGRTSLLDNTTGSYNSAYGGSALRSNITGTYNTGLGYNANVGSTSLTNATAIGYNALVNSSNTIQLGNSSVIEIYAGTGTNATLITGGLQVTGGSPGIGKVLTSDAFGVATWQSPGGGGGGNWSLTGNAGTVDGTNFIGTTDNVPFNIRVNNETAGRIDQSLESTFYGFRAGRDNTAGRRNTALGFEALLLNTEGAGNTAVGHQSLYSNDKGEWNTAIGVSALYSNDYGAGNTSVGYEALMTNSTGEFNSGFGLHSLYFNTTGTYNTATGSSSMSSNTTGSFNTATGSGALELNTTGSANVANGVSAGNAITTGNNNTAIGTQSLQTIITGSNNTALGCYANVSSSGLTNSTAIGYQAISNANDKIRIGNTTVTVVEGPVAYTFSDGRFKNNISEKEVHGLDFIKRLRPVVYNLDTKGIEEFLTQHMPDSMRTKYLSNRDFKTSSTIRQSGFIAQEVEAAAKKIGYDFNGVHIPASGDDNYSLAYGQFVVPLVKAVQELSSQNEELSKLMEKQKIINASLKNEIEELKALITNKVVDNNTGAIKITKADSEGRLFQNAPNPFTTSTTIRYTLPSSAKKAVLIITTAEGKKIREFNLNGQNQKNIEIAGGQLTAGIYIYSLLVDDVQKDSKTMILTK